MFVIQNVTVFRERVFYPYFRIEKPFFHLIFFFLLFFLGDNPKRSKADK